MHTLGFASVLIYKGAFDPLNSPIGPYHRPSIVDTPKLELKALPSYLKYAFLGDDDTLSMIISVGLSNVQVKAALLVLKKSYYVSNVRHTMNKSCLLHT